ncbi:MAG: hypothetical protein RTV31_07500 [Candidatus Thorarchaeota archaeon]
MGLFDRWRRKKKPVATVQLKEPKKTKTEDAGSAEPDTEGVSEDVDVLIAEYERLVQRREELQVERHELTATLDRGEIDPDEFRKELMNRIQEAATVSDNLRNTATKLTSLGYRGYH